MPAAGSKDHDGGPPLVFITGATGHIGFRILVHSLEAGYRVRIASRSITSAKRLATLPSIKPFADAKTTDGNPIVSFTKIPDFLLPTAFDTALQDVTYVIHAASPLPDFTLTSFDLDADYLNPAKDGTLNLLHAATKHPSIQRVVITSSVGVLTRPVPPALATKIIGPDDTASVPSRDAMATNSGRAYNGSKILALLAVEEFVSVHHRSLEFDVAHILPSYVQGRNEAAASLKDLAGKTSNANIVRFVLGQKSQVPDFADLVHVDDVASAHVNALTADLGQSEDNGEVKRFIVADNGASGPSAYEEVERIVRKRFADEVERGVLPLGGNVNVVTVGEIGYDVGLTEDVLGLKGRWKGLEEMVVSLVGQAVEFVDAGERLNGT
jgi:nucleoside-diphosphate-sugar epimerase